MGLLEIIIAGFSRVIVGIAMGFSPRWQNMQGRLDDMRPMGGLNRMECPVKVVNEDNHIIVVEKPINVPTQADASGDPDLLGLIKVYVKEKYQKPGNVYLGLVHRLDRPVGGLMVFAKTSKAAGRLSKQVREHLFQKTYLAVVHGIPTECQGQLVHYLMKDAVRNQVAVVGREIEGAKEAVLTYNVLETQGDLSLVQVQLKTGRSHQIRVQLAAIGHPLFGDQKYGAAVNRPGQQLALWSYELSFIHPVQNVRMAFHSQPPSVTPWNQFQILSRELHLV